MSTSCLGQVWTGAVDNNWSNPENWSPNGIPNTRIEIPASSNPPRILEVVPDIQSLTVKEGTSLQIEESGSLQIINEQTSIGLNNKGTIHNKGSISIKEAASFGISNDGILINDGTIETENVGMHGIFNFDQLTNNGQITVRNSQDVGIENVGVFDNLANIQVESIDSMGMRNYSQLNNSGHISIRETGTIGFLNVSSFRNDGTIHIENTATTGIRNHQTFDNYGTIQISETLREGVINYSNIHNYGEWNVSNSGLQGVMNYVSFINHSNLTIENAGKNGFENLTYLENFGTTQILHSQNVGIFNAGTCINHHLLTIDESITAGVWSQIKFENHGEMYITNTTWSGIANLGEFTNTNLLEILHTSNRGIENQSTFTNEKCAIIRINDSIVNGLNSDIINWGFITISYEQDNWNQSNITNHGIIEDLYDSFGNQPINNIGAIIRPVQICQDKTLGVAIKQGEADYLEIPEIWYSNEERTLSAGFYDQAKNEYATVMPLGDHWLYFEVTDLSNACNFEVKAQLNVSENPSVEVITEAVSCFGGNDGSISVRASGGSNVYDFLWNNEDFADSLQLEVSADSYELTVMDSQTGCHTFQSIEVTEPPLLATNFEQTQWVSGPEITQNQFHLEIIGGVAPYAYELLSDSEDTAVQIAQTSDKDLQIDASPLNPWALQITDANECSYQFDLGVGGDDDINFPIIHEVITINETDLGESDGGIEVIVAEGDDTCGEYTYEWSNGDIDSDIDYAFAGGYTVVITDCVGNSTTAFIELERDGEKNQNRKALKVFPSPASDWTNVRLISENEDEVLVRLFDTHKRLIQTIYAGNIEGETMYETVLDIRGLPSGVYYVQLTTPSGQHLSKTLMTIK